MTRKNFSEKREAIYSVIRNTKCHPSAEWVYNQLKDIYPNVSLGTVYRNMAMFAKQGIINSIGTINGKERFDANTSPHSHFICEECGEISDIEEVPYNPNMDRAVTLNTGYTVKKHELFFYGKCRKCTEKY